MPAAVALAAGRVDLLRSYEAAMRAAGRKTGRSTMQAARSFCAKLERAGGWDQMSRPNKLDAIRKARSFASWLMVTGQLTVDADVFGRVYLRLGTAARTFCPAAHRWFVEACARIGVADSDVTIQWNSLAMITAVTGVPADRIADHEFDAASRAVIDAYVARARPESGRNMASIFHRLRLTLFHPGQLDSHRPPPRRAPVSVTGWAVVAPGFAESARRYVEQVTLSLRPATVKHIEQHLRVFGTWLAEHHPEVASCADLERHHIEAFKAWLASHRSRRTGKPLSRTSIKEQLINSALLLRPHRGVGLPEPAATAADLHR